MFICSVLPYFSKGVTMNLFPVNTEYTKLPPLVREISGRMKNLHHWCEKLPPPHKTAAIGCRNYERKIS